MSDLAPVDPDEAVEPGEAPARAVSGRGESDRVVIVTGGASGIGEATCVRLARSGWTVIVLDRDAVGAQRVADGVGGVPFGVNVADADAVNDAVERVVAEHGGITALVNNAGVGNLRRLEDYTPAQVDLIWQVNFAGAYNCLRACAEGLRKHRGSVVNVASVSGIRPTRGEAPYSAAKAALVALTKSAALEWAPEVRVNCISPGFIRSPLNEMLAEDPEVAGPLEARTPAARMGSVDDVTGVIEFLLSADAAYVTGQNLAIDGGTLLSSTQMDPILGPLLDMYN